MIELIPLFINWACRYLHSTDDTLTITVSVYVPGVESVRLPIFTVTGSLVPLGADTPCALFTTVAALVSGTVTPSTVSE